MDIDLRKLTLDDTSNIVCWRNQPWLLEYFIDQRKITKESHEKYVKTRIQTGIVKQWIIVVDGVDVGTCFLRDINYETNEAEYGVLIGEKDYLSKGIGSKVVCMVLEYAFKVMNLDHVFVRVQEKNPRSINSFLKAGFKYMDHVEEVLIHEQRERIVFLSINKETFLGAK